MGTLANDSEVVHVQPHLLDEVATRLKQAIPETLSVSFEYIFGVLSKETCIHLLIISS